MHKWGALCGRFSLDGKRFDRGAEIQNFPTPVKMLDKGRAAFHPIAVIHVLDAINHSHFRGMDMAADDPLAIAQARLAHNRRFKI